MSKDRPVLMWVAPKFKIKIKVESAKKDQSIFEYTKELAEQDSIAEQVDELQKDSKSKRRFNIGF